MAQSALVAAHASGLVAVALHTTIRVFDTRSGISETLPQAHTDTVTVLAFNEGDDKHRVLLASAADDKSVRVWELRQNDNDDNDSRDREEDSSVASSSWQCLVLAKQPKRPSAGAFVRGSRWFAVADKFGMIYAIPTTAAADRYGDAVTVIDNANASALLGHCCSIITDLAVSPDDRLLVSCDRDNFIRVRAQCFVTAVAYIKSRLVSTSGDGTVKLWNCEDGELLDSLSLAHAADEERDGAAPVVALASCSSTSTVAVVQEGQQAVRFLRVDTDAGKLYNQHTIALPKGMPPPTSLCFSPSSARLWAVCAERLTTDSCCVRVAAFDSTESSSIHLVDAASLPEGLVECFAEGVKVPESGGVGDAAGGQRTKASDLKKRSYTQGEREFRKQRRNDKKAPKTAYGGKRKGGNK
eukprot:jgi/Chlat1/6007/Chrsp4S06196